MSESLNSVSSNNLSLIDYLQVIAKRIRIVALITATACVISICISLMIPKIYSATAKILPSQPDQGLMSAMINQMGGLVNLAADVLGTGSSSDLYVGLLKSEVVKDAIIDRFKLMKEYDAEYRVDVYRILDENVEITSGKKDGIISITVEDKDPQLAASLANAYIGELEKLVIRLNATGAGQSKSYLEKQLTKAKTDLARAEDDLKEFQLKNKSIQITAQAEASIKGIAELRAQLTSREIELASLRSRFTDSAQEVITAQAYISDIRKQISRFEGNGNTGAIPSVGQIPELGQEYIRLMREYKTYETLVELLSKQYELSNISEARNVSSLQIVQKARVPDKKSKPRRSLIVLLSTCTSFFASILLVFLINHWEHLSIDQKDRWRSLINSGK
ncbi:MULTISPECIES: GumC family protein [Geobacter]|uniref:GumC family protein n=1 Tax=Geobacter TaxID=28231 RepID=UPI0020B77CBB|nr:GNVR domain-containing protein [Geobacter sulfurreducens]UTG91321.1 lipopolysaccharide biosynthesis protein [Geobacter sulfurreducens]BEH10146.1 Wzz/FepE/Etk N-terminal domain-containing protein [Geobacter sulfurreducens subsp. ethanolicus]BET58267.1 Wzz/FepE/Etk N-terminal domain-containing protein [Geobacter sp. 60473]